MLKFQLWSTKSYIRRPKPDEKIKLEPSIFMVKDLLEEDVDGHVIYFCEEAARIAKPDKKDKHRPVVGMPVVSVKIGDHCYGSQARPIVPSSA